jgi:DNA-binding LacI/PurR family transcriptional regulator
LGIGQKGASPAKVLEQLKSARAWGVIVDVHSPGVVHLAKQSGLSVVMVDAWHEDAEVDAVIQDGFRGGLLAAKHLAGRGHRRIGWLGPVSESIHSMTRFGGATSGLRRSGLELPPELQADTAGGPGFEAARALLSRPDRPTGLLALWRDMALDAAKAARELGLHLDSDLEIVGWCAEELYEKDYAAHFADGPVPPAVVWSIATLADTAVARLAERRANPGMPPLRLSVNTRLRLTETKEGAQR